MADCPVIAKCLFFNDKMEHMPEMAELLKVRLCRGDNSTCARYMVLQAKGREYVPPDLPPLDIERAKKLCGE